MPPSPPHRRLLPAATPMAFVRAIVQAYARYRRDPAGALRQARITPAALALPDGRITALQMETICSVAMQELDDEALGWFARRLPWGSHGMLCRASLGSVDLGLALQRWCRHYRLLNDDIALHLEIDGPVASLRIEEHRPLAGLGEFCLVTNLRYVHGYACWAIDSRIPLLSAEFPFSAPPHEDAYPLMFRGPLRFGAPAAGFRFDAQYLRLPLRRDERALQAMLRRALPLTVLQYRRDRLLVQRVRELLADPAAGVHTADGLAAALHVSVRTLHRQLRDENASVQGLKDEVRRERAVDGLRRSGRSIKQIAHDVHLRPPVVAPERLAVDDEERRAEDAACDRRVVRRLERGLPGRIGPGGLGRRAADAEIVGGAAKGRRIGQVDTGAGEVGPQAVARPGHRPLRRLAVEPPEHPGDVLGRHRKPRRHGKRHAGKARRPLEIEQGVLPLHRIGDGAFQFAHLKSRAEQDGMPGDRPMVAGGERRDPLGSDVRIGRREVEVEVDRSEGWVHGWWLLRACGEKVPGSRWRAGRAGVRQDGERASPERDSLRSTGAAG